MKKISRNAADMPSSTLASPGRSRQKRARCFHSEGEASAEGADRSGAELSMTMVLLGSHDHGSWLACSEADPRQAQGYVRLAVSARLYQSRLRLTLRTSQSITGTSISTPTTVASAAPELKP